MCVIAGSVLKVRFDHHSLCVQLLLYCCFVIFSRLSPNIFWGVIDSGRVFALFALFSIADLLMRVAYLLFITLQEIPAKNVKLALSLVIYLTRAPTHLDSSPLFYHCIGVSTTLYDTTIYVRLG